MNEKTLPTAVALTELRDALDTAKEGIKNAKFLVSQAMEAHGYCIGEEGNQWLESVLNSLENSENRLKKYHGEDL